MVKEKLLFDPKSARMNAKRVLVSDSPEEFVPATSRVGRRILSALAAGPKYPAEIAREIGADHQAVYYHIGRLEKAGLIVKLRTERIRGGEASVFSLTSDGYAVEFPVKGEPLPTLQSSTRPKALGRFFNEFVQASEFDGCIVVGSPLPHGASATQARDGHYAVQLGFALGQYVTLPTTFPVKLDVDLKAERLQGSNLIVIGGPRTNVISDELNRYLPVRFKEGGFWGSIVDRDGRSYNSEVDSVVVKVKNPWNREKTCILAAGLTGAGTKAAIIGICNFADVLFRRYVSGEFSSVLRGLDKDGDGKVDSVEILG